MLEAMEIIDKALSQDEFEHHGPLLEIPKRRLSPRPVQHPRPPMYVIATSVESHQIAGERGHGVISCDNWRGWDHLTEQADVYRSAIATAKPPSGVLTESLGCCALTGYCADVGGGGRGGRPDRVQFLNDVLEYLYLPLANASKDYDYFKKTLIDLADLRHTGDAKKLNERTPTSSWDPPDQPIEKIKKLEGLGYDEVVMRIDGLGHQKLMKSLELIGKYVIPEFNRPNSVILCPRRSRDASHDGRSHGRTGGPADDPARRLIACRRGGRPRPPAAIRLQP